MPTETNTTTPDGQRCGKLRPPSKGPAPSSTRVRPTRCSKCLGKCCVAMTRPIYGFREPKFCSLDPFLDVNCFLGRPVWCQTRSSDFFKHSFFITKWPIAKEATKGRFTCTHLIQFPSLRMLPTKRCSLQPATYNEDKETTWNNEVLTTKYRQQRIDRLPEQLTSSGSWGGLSPLHQTVVNSRLRGANVQELRTLRHKLWEQLVPDDGDL